MSFCIRVFCGTHKYTQSKKRTASVRASTEVQCLVLTRADVIRLIGNLQDIYPNRPAEPQLSVPSRADDQDPDISLANLAVMSILGEGGFGKVSKVVGPFIKPIFKVELVKVRKQNRFYARKRVAKTKINKKDMQLEKQIMQQQECKFIVKLYYTLSDQYYVYLLMVCLSIFIIIKQIHRSHVWAVNSGHI